MNDFNSINVLVDFWRGKAREFLKNKETLKNDKCALNRLIIDGLILVSIVGSEPWTSADSNLPILKEQIDPLIFSLLNLLKEDVYSKS